MPAIATPDRPVAGAPPPKAPEPPVAPEVKPRERVLQAFQESFTLYKNALQPLQVKADRDKSSLTPDEQRKLDVFRATEAAKKQTIDQNKDTFANEVKDAAGATIVTIQEGVPVEGVLEHLNEQVDSLAQKELQGTGTDADKQELRKLVKLRDTLTENSKSYFEIPGRPAPDSPEGKARIEQESAQGEGVDGAAVLQNRRELVVPAESEQTVEAQPNPEAEHAQQQMEVAAIAGAIKPELAHEMIKVIAEKGNIGSVLRGRGEALMSGSIAENGTVTDASQFALGVDLQRAALQLRREELMKVHRRKGGFSSLERNEWAAVNSDLQHLEAGRKGGEFQMRDGKVIKVDLSKEPNQLSEFAKKLGVMDEDAETSPIQGIMDLLNTAFTDKQVRNGFIESIQNSQLFKPEDIDSVGKFINHEAFRKGVEKKLKLARNAGVGVGAFMLLMMWLSSKQERGQQG